MKCLSQPQSPLVSDLRALFTSRLARERSGRFLADGLRFVARALDSPYYTTHRLIVAPDLLRRHPLGLDLIARARERALPVHFVSRGIFASLTIATEPQGIAVEASPNVRCLGDLPTLDERYLAVVVDVIRSPGNLGTILRTMDAVGADALIVVGEAIDPFAPSVVRATMGSLFGVSVVVTDAPALASWRARQGVALVGASPSAPISVREAALPERLALYLGSERKGLSPGLEAACDACVRLPQEGLADSLNVAVAAGVLLYEAFWQRDARKRRGG